MVAAEDVVVTTMKHSTPFKSRLPALVAVSVALFSAPAASAALTATIDTVANTLTLVVNDGSWMTAIANGEGSALRNQSSSDSQYFAQTSIATGSAKTGGTGDWDSPVSMVLMALNTGSGVDWATLSGFQLVTDSSPSGTPVNWSGTMVGTFTDLSNYTTSGQSLGFNLFGSTSGPIVVSVIPEPSAALLGGIGLLACFRRRRIG